MKKKTWIEEYINGNVHTAIDYVNTLSKGLHPQSPASAASADAVAALFGIPCPRIGDRNPRSPLYGNVDYEKLVSDLLKIGNR